MDPQEIAAQRIINEMTGGNKTNEIPTGLAICPQCGYLHPPIKPGERCPSAPVKVEGISNDEVTQFLGNLKNILINNIEKNKLKNPKKLFQTIILKVNEIVSTFKDE